MRYIENYRISVDMVYSISNFVSSNIRPCKSIHISLPSPLCLFQESGWPLVNQLAVSWHASFERDVYCTMKYNSVSRTGQIGQLSHAKGGLFLHIILFHLCKHCQSHHFFPATNTVKEHCALFVQYFQLFHPSSNLNFASFLSICPPTFQGIFACLPYKAMQIQFSVCGKLYLYLPLYLFLYLYLYLSRYLYYYLLCYQYIYQYLYLYLYLYLADIVMMEDDKDGRANAVFSEWACKCHRCLYLYLFLYLYLYLLRYLYYQLLCCQYIYQYSVSGVASATAAYICICFVLYVYSYLYFKYLPSICICICICIQRVVLQVPPLPIFVFVLYIICIFLSFFYV